MDPVFKQWLVRKFKEAKALRTQDPQGSQDEAYAHGRVQAFREVASMFGVDLPDDHVHSRRETR